MERLLTTEEVADFLRIDPVTVRRLVARGELIAYRIAGEYRFTEANVEQFVQSQRVVVSTPPQGPITRWRNSLSERAKSSRWQTRKLLGTIMPGLEQNTCCSRS